MEAGQTVKASGWQLLLLGFPLLFAGCRSPDVYYWGQYEDIVYVMYGRPDKAPPERQAEIMEADLQRAVAANKPVPPGFHAHLGYVYYELGKPDLASGSLSKKKRSFRNPPFSWTGC